MSKKSGFIVASAVGRIPERYRRITVEKIDYMDKIDDTNHK